MIKDNENNKERIGNWPVKMARNKLIIDLMKKENIPLNKAKEKAEEIILDTKKWSLEIITDILAYELVKKESIPFNIAREKAKKWLLDSRKKGRIEERKFNAIVKELSKKHKIPFDEVKERILDYIEKEVMETAGLAEVYKELESDNKKISH